MASQLLGIKTRFTNDLGSPLVGGQVYTYFAGTSTNQDTYSDAALTVPNTNPVILDDTGSADIFLKGSYRIRVFDASGRFIEEQDNVTQVASQGDATEINERIDAVQGDIEKVKLDTGITVTAKFGGVERTQAEKNAETVSLLDFGAPYTEDSTAHLQQAIDYLDSIGGGELNIPYKGGVLRLDGEITLKPNILVRCDDTLLIDGSRFVGLYQFRGVGSAGDEINISKNIGSGDKVVDTVSPHGLVVGDNFLLVSQRECAHEDAGEIWRLGDTTGGVDSPYFAEPMTVLSVPTASKVGTRERVIFPDYRTDNLQEQSPRAKSSALIKKMNMFSNFRWIGGKFLKSRGALFHLEYAKDCYIKTSAEWTGGWGFVLHNLYSLRTEAELVCKRPVELDMDRDHSLYNSVRDVSSWYSKITVSETNGIQGIDQSYRDFCSLYPVYDMTHYNSHEVAMTFHGNCYGATVKVVGYNCKYSCFYNRARGVVAEVRAFNCGFAVSAADWGMVDCDYNVHGVSLIDYGVYFTYNRTTALVPVNKNTVVSGRIMMSPNTDGTAVRVRGLENGEPLNGDSNISLQNLKIRDFYRAVNLGEGINGVSFDNVDIEHNSSEGAIWIQGRTAGHKFTNVKATINNEGTDSQLVVMDSPAVGLYDRPAIYIDHDTCSVKNGVMTNASYMTTQGTRLVFNGSVETTSYGRVRKENLSREYYLKATGTGGRSDNRLVLHKSIPVNYEITFFVEPNAEGAIIGIFLESSLMELIVYRDDITALGAITLTDKKMFKLRKISESEFVIF